MKNLITQRVKLQNYVLKTHCAIPTDVIQNAKFSYLGPQIPRNSREFFATTEEHVLHIS